MKLIYSFLTLLFLSLSVPAFAQMPATRISQTLGATAAALSFVKTWMVIAPKSTTVTNRGTTLAVLAGN